MEKNQIHAFPSTFHSSSSHSFDSIDSKAVLKYYGLQKKNFFTMLRKDIVQLASYIYSVSPPCIIVHRIMAVIRILQFLLPCLIPAYLTFWQKGTPDQVTMNIIAVLYYLIPPTVDFRGRYILFLIYIVIQLIVILTVIFSSFYFKKHAKLPKIIPILIYFYQATFGHYFHPIILYSIFEAISYLVTDNFRTQISTIRLCFLFVIAFICVCFNFFFITISSGGQTLPFRPTSLPSITSQSQFIIIVATILINIFFGIAINLPKSLKIFFFLLNIILYASTTYSLFLKGGFIQEFVSNIIISSSVTGAVFTLVDLIFIILDKKASIAIFFCFIVFFIIMIIANFFIIQKSNLKKLNLLDSIEEDNTCFSFVKSPNHFINLATCGMKYAHPVILDLTFFNLGIERWPKNQYVYLIFAKFIAIYPEETVTLKFIYKTVKLQKLRGSAIRCIKKQTPSILKNREFGFTSELRSKINGIRKQNASNKHRLGHVWDIVIRGNLNEIETATKHAISSINETNVDLKHLLREYPNNRNVTYFYSIFLNDLMADHLLSKEMHERTKMLLPGVTVFEDQTYEYGLKTFPELPASIKAQKEPIILSSTMEGVPNYDKDQNEIDLDNERLKELDQIAGLKRNISDLVIPSIIGTKVIRIITLALFAIPCIFGLIYMEFYIKSLQRPLQFIGSLSMLQVYAFQVIGFSLRFVGEELDIFNKNISKDEPPPESFGGSWETRKQLEYILEATTNAIQEFGAFRTFKENDADIDEARSLIFQNLIPYDYYTSPNNFTTSSVSISGAILDFTIQQKIILSAYNITEDILSAAAILNPVMNIFWISRNILQAMNSMMNFIDNNYMNSINIRKIVLVTLIIFYVVIFCVTLFIEIRWLNSNKRETYQCLFSLPKSVVSNLAENREMKKTKENQPEDMNKQDETILKIFNSSGNTESSLSDVIFLIVGTFFMIFFAVICIILFSELVMNLNNIIRNSAPHLHYLLASYSMILGAENCLNEIFFETNEKPISMVTFKDANIKMQYHFELSRHYYHLISAGGPTNQEVPFTKFTEGVRNAFPPKCEDYDDLNITRDLSKRLLSTEEDSFNLSKILECSPVDMTFILIEPTILYSLIPFRYGFNLDLSSKDPNFDAIWLNLITPIFDKFFDPLYKQILPSILDNLKNQKNNYIPFIAVLLVAGFFVELLMFFQIMSIENHIRSVISLLLHCSPSVIFSSTKIMRILSGDFSSQQNDSLERNNGFFDTVFKSLPDAIMIANSEMIILQANEACKHIFGKDVELVGKSIRDFFMSSNFSGNTEVLFSSVNSNPTEEIAYKTGSSELILKSTSMIACGKFVIYCRDVTQSHNYNTLILSEKQNSDKLLSTILPPSLVGRVQEGEKNISFSVQSASILFSDIVSFTPWCGSLPAEKVMSTLNFMFKRMDSILDTKHTMTKIKCIGDCYMAAGGIFAEINQPMIHAKEVVSFGLQSIKEIVSMNKEIHEKLRIRVGVNTGGPIVAGVLGIGKPTFEIIGPAINRAQQMEQNGVPMNVHISYAVYELICGLNFKIYNRRTIECKDGKVETYLVEP